MFSTFHFCTMPATAGGFIVFRLILFDFWPLRFFGFCATAFFCRIFALSLRCNKIYLFYFSIKIRANSKKK